MPRRLPRTALALSNGSVVNIIAVTKVSKKVLSWTAAVGLVVHADEQCLTSFYVCPMGVGSI